LTRHLYAQSWGVVMALRLARVAQEEEEGANGRGPHVSGGGGKWHVRKAQTKEESVFSQRRYRNVSRLGQTREALAYGGRAGQSSGLGRILGETQIRFEF
jgi:hypothetical protein